MKANLELNTRRKESVVVTVSDGSRFLRRIYVSSNGFIKCKDYDGKVESIQSVKGNGQKRPRKRAVNRNIGKRGIS